MFQPNLNSTNQIEVYDLASELNRLKNGMGLYNSVQCFHHPLGKCYEHRTHDEA